MSSRETPSQTAGPYWHIGMQHDIAGLNQQTLTLGKTPFQSDSLGKKIVIEGVIWDGSGTLVTDAMIEMWQADHQGVYAQGLDGWARTATDFDTGQFQFETIKPGSVTALDGRSQAPHIAIWIVARGINLGLHTRLYFSDEIGPNKRDPLLSRLPPDRRKTLIATKTRHAYKFDIRLQGDSETVFLNV